MNEDVDALIWPYRIWMYFNILKKVNSNYIKLNNLDGKNNNFKRENLYYEIFEGITQIIPYKIKDGKLKIREEEGILELLNNQLPFVKECFELMFTKYKDNLIHIKTSRNNVEHSPHRLLICSQTGTKGYSRIILNYRKKGVDITKIGVNDIEYCYCDSEILDFIIKELNVLFRKIRKEIYKLSKEGKIDSEMSKIYSKYRFRVK